MNTTGAMLAALTQQFIAAGIPDPACDAEWLLAHLLGCSRTNLLLDANQSLDNALLAQLAQLAKRRCHREPLQYLLGTQDFYGRTFAVTPDVLIPRPETEQLVALALERLPTAPDGDVLDIGTGSGCIAVTLLLESTRAAIATDISAAALAVAAQNADAHQVTSRLTLCGPVDCWPTAPQQFAAIVSNPPYLTATEGNACQPELRFEPITALTAGADGLDILRRIVRHAADWLAPNGVLCLEVGATQTGAVAALAQDAGLVRIEQHRDWQGALRFVTAYSQEHSSPL